MKSLISIKGIALSLSLIFVFLAPSRVYAYADSETLIQVGDNVITGYDLNAEIARIKTSFAAQQRELPNAKGLLFMAVDELVKRQVVLAQGKRMGVRISDSHLEQALSQVAQQNGLRVDQLPAAIRSQGMDFDRYISDLRNQIALGQIRERIQLRAGDVSEKEINQYLLANPQLKTGETKYSFWAATLPLNEATQSRRQELIEELNAYAKSFADGVLPPSDDFIDVRDGKDINAVTLPVQLVDILTKLEEGEVSTPFRSPLGYHVVKLNSVNSQHDSLKQYRYAQIIVAKRNYATDENARQVIETALAQLDADASFDVVAARFSEDPNARENFGDIGWMVPEQFPESFIRVVGRLEVGEVSPIIESAVGFHVLKVTDSRELNEQQALRESARVQVIGEKQQRAFNEWVNEAMDKAYIQVLDAEIGAIYP